MHIRRWARRAAWALLGAVLIVAAAATAVSVWAGTSGGRTWLAALANRALAGQARIAGVGGSLPFHPAVESVDLLDPDGVWAHLADVRLDLVPGDLLRRRITVANLSAASIDVLRQPMPEAPPRPSPPRSSLQDLLRARLPPIDLQNVKASVVTLPADLLGEPSRWTVAGRARLIEGDAQLDLDVAGSEPSPIKINGQLELAGDRLDIRATVDDPEGFLLHRQFNKNLPLHIDLADDPGALHTLADWHGHVAGSIGNCAQIDAGIHLVTDKTTHTLETEGRVANTCSLPPDLAPLVGGEFGFRLRVRDIGEFEIRLDELKLKSSAVQADAEGVYHLGDKTADASLEIHLPDLAPLSAVAGQRLAGAADLALTAAGPMGALQAALDLHGSHLAYAGNAVDATDAHIAAQVLAGGGYSVDASGDATGLQTTMAHVPAPFAAHLSWALAGSTDAALEKFTLTTLGLTSAGSTVAASGSFDRRSEAVAGAMALHSIQVAPFGAAGGLALTGRGQLAATVEGALSGPIRAHLSGDLAELATGIPVADALTGGTVALDMDARRAADGTIVLSATSLRLAHAVLGVTGTVDPTTEKVNGTVDARIDDLSALRQAGFPAAGRASLSGTINGSMQAPVVDAHLEGGNLSWAMTHIDSATVHVRAAAAGAPSGDVTAELRAKGTTVSVSGEGGLSPDRKTLTLERLHIASGGNIVDGHLRTALDTLLTSGQITARLPDLASLSPVLEQRVSGSATLDLALVAQGGQGVKLALTADKLRAAMPGAPPLQVRHLAMTGAVTDLLRHPGGHLEATGDDIGVAGAEIHRTQLSAKTLRADRFAVSGDAQGTFKGAFSVALGGEVETARDGVRATLDRLQGRVADTPIRLQRPVLVAIHGPALRVTDLALDLGGATVTGSARMEADTLDVKLDARDLPVALAGTLTGRTDLGGSVDAHVEIAGSASQPHGQITLAGRQLRLGPARRGSPVADVAAKATLAPGKIDLAVTVDALGHRLASVTGFVPLAFGPRPGMVAAIDDGPMRLKVEGEAELADFLAVLPLDGDRVAGHAHVAMEATGTLARPVISGSVSLDHGHYEDPATAMVIDALALDVAAQGEQVVVHRFSATDGGDGRIEGQGTVSLGSASPSVDLAVTLTRFQALRRGDATLTASGNAKLSGPLTAPVLEARLTVDKSEFQVADPLPPSAQRIPVTVIDLSTGQVLEKPGQQEAVSSFGQMRLDIAVHVPNRTFVRGRGLESEWRGDIQVRGTSAAPEVTGSLGVVNGTFSFFGKDLALTHGTVTFIGGRTVEPDIDLVAETTTADGTFDVGIKGTPDELKIALSSNPEMPQDEILAYLIFGRDVTRLTPQEGIELAQAAVTLANGGSGILNSVRHRLGLDVLSVGNMNNSLQPTAHTNASGASTTGNGTATGDTGVSAGKYVASGIYVGAEQGLSGETRSKVEVQILPHVTVEGGAGTRSDDIGINWQTDY